MAELTTCPRCKGTGEVKLRKAFASTMRCLPKKGEVTSEEVSRRLGLKPSTTWMRLMRLEGLGKVKSRIDGGRNYWRRA